VRAELLKLDAFGAVAGNVALFRLTTPQFFMGRADGSYPDATEAFDGRYACVNPPNQTDHDWRNDAVRRAHLQLGCRHVLLVPTLPWMHAYWDSALGSRPNVIPGDPASPRVADCTHFCEGPFLWEPLWWALAVAAHSLL
jgi:hypothetical protein